MDPRENLLNIYRRQGIRWAPVEIGLCPALQEKYRAVAGDASFEEHFDFPEGFACRNVPGARRTTPDVDWHAQWTAAIHPEAWFDPWGVAHEPGDAATAYHLTRMRHPMAAFDSLEQMQAWPRPEYDGADVAHIREAVDAAHAAGRAAAGVMECTIWEQAWYLRDMTVLMTDMTMEDEKAVWLLDCITEQACVRAAAFARGGTDVLRIGDDVGMQRALMMSGPMYREWLQPRLAQVVAAARAEKPDVVIHYHSCGYVEPLIPDLIEAGVDVLNPVQPECMDFAKLHAEFGDRLSFSGTIGTQTTMPFGSPEDVRRTTLRNLETAGPGGGLVACPTHMLEPETPWENVEAYVAACREFSRTGA